MPNVTGGDKSGTRTGVTGSNSGERSVLITISAIGNPDIVTGVEILVSTCYTSNCRGSYRNIILSADYRFYNKRFRWSHAEIRVDRLPVQRQSQMQLGLTGVPFGIQPIASHNFFLQNRLLHRTRGRFRHRNQVFISR